MKTTRAWPVLVAALVLVLPLHTVRAGDWKTSDGKVYQDVKLIRVDADTVTILHKDGGAQIPLAKLSPDLQQRFGYDPALAKAAADARAKEAALNAKLLQAEMNQASEMHQAGREPAPVAGAPETADDATGPIFSPAPSDAEAPADSSNDTHHFLDALVGSASSLSSATGNSSHHTINDLAQSASAMRRDLNDPTYHTTSHLVYTVRRDGLGPDTSDPNHYAIGQATGGAAK